MSTPVEPKDVAQLCAAHYQPLHAHVRRKLPQRSDADDVVQETWLRVVRIAASGLLSNGRAYLYRVAHNLSRGTRAAGSRSLACTARYWHAGLPASGHTSAGDRARFSRCIRRCGRRRPAMGAGR